MTIDWREIFDEIYPEQGASEGAIALLVGGIRYPLTSDEMETINSRQRNPFRVSDALYTSWRPLDPTTWSLPVGPLPSDYLSLLRWSNGGDFRTGEQWLQFYPVESIRELLLLSHTPQYMPGVLPFATDAGDCVYAFDMRQPPVDGEYPTLVVDDGDLDFETAVVAANSFVALCRNTIAAPDLLGKR